MVSERNQQSGDRARLTGEESLATDQVSQGEIEPQGVVAAATVQDNTNAELTSDFDNAFAWLESLAAKQGAQDGTLIRPLRIG